MLHVDTLKIAKRIEESGLTREQADAIASSLHEVDTSDLATKGDVSALRDEIEGLRSATRGDMAVVRAELKQDMEKLHADLTRQIYLAQAATIGILFTLLRFVP